MAEEKTKGTKLGQATAAVAGAVVGAGIGVAATKVLSDKEKREKIVRKMSDVRDQVMDAVDVQVAPQIGDTGTKGGKAKKTTSSKSKSSTSKTGSKSTK